MHVIFVLVTATNVIIQNTVAFTSIAVELRSRLKSNIRRKSSLIEEASTKNKYDWSFLDAVYLITCPNAEGGSNRLDRAKNILDKVDLLDGVKIKQFETDDENRIRGCYTSHMAVLREASSTGKKMILVLEDNLSISNNLSFSLLDSLKQFLFENKIDDSSFDMIHLSYTPFVPNFVVKRSHYENVIQLDCGIGSALGTTAYIISESGIQSMLRKDESMGGYYDAPIPDVMTQCFDTTRYALYPAPFLRSSNTKSLINPQLDTLRQLLFQPAVYTAFVNLLVFTQLGTNTVFPIIVASLILLSLWSMQTSIDAAIQILQTGMYNGNILLPVLSALFSIFSLAVIAVGVVIAPKSEDDPKK